MKFILTLLLTVCLFKMNGQTVNIPDSTFENILIYKGIDSDGIVNGQILNNDVLNTTVLNLNDTNLYWVFEINTLSGLESFINLETLSVIESNIPSNSLEFSNFPQLVNLKWLSNQQTLVDFSQNANLRRVEIGNLALDVGNHNTINYLDFSNNSNINFIDAYNLFTLNKINLRNNTSEELFIQLGNETNYPYNVCIEVDDVQAVTNNLPPYDSWTVNGNHFFSDNCTLNIEKFINNNYKIYPNPTCDFINIEEKVLTNNKINSIYILDYNGKLVKYIIDSFNRIDVQNLSNGIYLLIINTNKGNKVEKFIKK